MNQRTLTIFLLLVVSLPFLSINYAEAATTPQPKISVSPKSVNITPSKKAVPPHTKDLTISNIGSADLVIGDITLTGPNSSEFSQANNCVTIIPGSSCVVTATFTPNSTRKKTAAITIQSNDPKKPLVIVKLTGKSSTGIAGTLQFSNATYKTSEGYESALVTVRRIGGSGGAVTVNYATADSTAVKGTDYTETTGTLNWAHGDYSDKTISIPIISDTEEEGDEIFSVILSSPTGGAVIGSIGSAAVTISYDNFTPQPVVPGTTIPEAKTVTTPPFGDTTIDLSDGTELVLPTSFKKLTVTLERKSNTIESSDEGIQMTGSLREVTISSHGIPAQDYTVFLRIPAAEYGTITADTINVLRISDMLQDGQLVQDVASLLTTHRDSNGDLIVSDPFIADSLAAAEAASSLVLAGMQRASQQAISPAATSVPAAKIKYFPVTFQNDLNWKTQPKLVRMVLSPSLNEKRTPLSHLPTADQEKELERCRNNIVVLVHGHNETEKAGFLKYIREDKVAMPWEIDYKRHVWTLFYEQYNYILTNTPDYFPNDDCTVFYEYIYPTYRPIFEGIGNLGDDLAQQLAQELQPLIDKRSKLNLFIVAHSMGGLVARAAIQNFTPEMHAAFQKLVTWGSPHHGSVVSTMRYLSGGPYYLIRNAPNFIWWQDFFKYFPTRFQLDTPGARDLRCDTNECSPLLPIFFSLKNQYWIPYFLTNEELNDNVRYNYKYNLVDGYWLYSKNTALLNQGDVYGPSNAPRNLLNNRKYAFIYGTYDNTCSVIWSAYFAGGTEICIGGKITWALTGVDMNDGAVPFMSMTAVGIDGDRIPLGPNINHEEYFGAPTGLPDTVYFRERAKAYITANSTFNALQLGDDEYSCLHLESLTPSSGAVGTTVTLTGAGFEDEQSTSTVTFNGIVAPVTSWSKTSIVVTVPTGATSGDVIVTVNDKNSNSKTFTVGTNDYCTLGYSHTGTPPPGMCWNYPTNPCHWDEGGGFAGWRIASPGTDAYGGSGCWEGYSEAVHGLFSGDSYRADSTESCFDIPYRHVSTGLVRTGVFTTKMSLTFDHQRENITAIDALSQHYIIGLPHEGPYTAGAWDIYYLKIKGTINIPLVRISDQNGIRTEEYELFSSNCTGIDEILSLSVAHNGGLVAWLEDCTGNLHISVTCVTSP